MIPPRFQSQLPSRRMVQEKCKKSRRCWQPVRLVQEAALPERPLRMAKPGNRGMIESLHPGVKTVMKKLLAFGFAIVFAGATATAQQVNVPARLGYPQTILFNGKIVTMDDSSFESRVGTIVQAMAIRDGKILATGNNADLRALAGPQTKQIDLKGRMVLPSFIHTHEHPTDWMWTEPEALKHALPEDNGFIMIRWLTGTAEEQKAKWETTLKDMAAQAKPGQWLWLSFSWGSDFENVEGLFDWFPKTVTRERVDQLVSTHPVRVRDAWPLQPQVMVNSKGLEEVRKVYDWAGTRSGASEASDPLGRQTEPDVIFQGRTDLLAKL